MRETYVIYIIYHTSLYINIWFKPYFSHISTCPIKKHFLWWQSSARPSISAQACSDVVPWGHHTTRASCNPMVFVGQIFDSWPFKYLCWFLLQAPLPCGSISGWNDWHSRIAVDALSTPSRFLLLRTGNKEYLQDLHEPRLESHIIRDILRLVSKSSQALMAKSPMFTGLLFMIFFGCEDWSTADPSC